MVDDGRGAGRVEERGVPVGLPPHAVRRASIGLVALDHLTGAVRLALMGGVDHDSIPDMRFHDDLPVMQHRLWCESQPARTGETEQGLRPCTRWDAASAPLRPAGAPTCAGQIRKNRLR